MTSLNLERTDKVSCVSFFCIGGEPKPELARDLATAYNPEMCPLALPVIKQKTDKKEVWKGEKESQYIAVKLFKNDRLCYNRK